MPARVSIMAGAHRRREASYGFRRCLVWLAESGALIQHSWPGVPCLLGYWVPDDYELARCPLSSKQTRGISSRPSIVVWDSTSVPGVPVYTRLRLTHQRQLIDVQYAQLPLVHRDPVA